MEKVETSEYCSLYRHYTGSFAICFRVDAERRINRVPWQKPRHKSHRSGESLPFNCCYINANNPQALGCSGRSRLSSRETHYTRRFERSKRFLWAAFGCAKILPSVQRSHQSRRSCPFDRLWLYLSCSWIEFCPCIQSAGVYAEVGCTRSHQGGRRMHTGGRHLRFWHGRDRGQFSSLSLPGV